MIDIFVFDIDGTLTDRRNGEIPASIDDAIKQLKSHKNTIIIATGRPSFEVSSEIKRRLQPDAIIYNNGKLVTDDQGKILHEAPIEESLLKASLERIHELCWDSGLHLRDHTLILKGTSIQQKIFDLTGKKAKAIMAKSKSINEPVFNIMVHVEDQQALDDFLKEFPALKAEAFAQHYYDLYPHGVTKATGIEVVLKLKHATWSRVMAFGDNLNDLEMLKKAYYGFVMEDGHPDLKKVKGLHLAKASGEDGISKALMKHGMIEHADNRFDWTRFKHRFVSTLMRYTLPISGFLMVSVIYDQMRGAFSVTTWTNLVLSLILLSSAIYEVVREEKH
jgi:Cof subfamily protein (haloacid dehalogenase superfamily)